MDPAPADVAIAQGRLVEAESLLYAAVSRAPREPASRGALGAFLASRGQLAAGATLLEEARQFGGDPRAIDQRLARIYRWSGDWSRRSDLRSAGFLPSERDLGRYLATRTPSLAGPDSAVIVLEPNELMGLGRLRVVVGGDSLDVDVDPAIEGLVLPSRVDVLASVQPIGAKYDTTLAVAPTVAIGAFSLSNVPVAVVGGSPARMGLDVLARLTPTFDLAARRLVLRRSRPLAARGVELPLLLGFPGVSIIARAGEGPVALGGAGGRTAIRGTRWTFDLERGAIVVER